MLHRRIDSPWGINPGPEEIAIDTWLDNAEPYVSLREPGDGGRTRRAGTVRHARATARAPRLRDIAHPGT